MIDRPTHDYQTLLGEPPETRNPKLFALFSADVVRVLTSILGPHADVEDELHNTFLDAFANVESLRDSAKLKSWLLCIAVNRARRSLRTRRRSRIDLVGSAHDMDVPMREPSGDESLRIAHQLYELLAQLDDDDRTVLLLRFLEQYTIAEIADLCTLSQATVKRRLDHAVQTLEKRASRHPAVYERIVALAHRPQTNNVPREPSQRGAT